MQWMCCDLGKVQPSPLMDHNFTIRVATAEDYLASADGEDEVAQALSTVVPRRVFHLIACRGDARLGKCILNISTGELGIGILFDMIVIGNERRKGVGKALVRAACEMAINMGCRLVMLNATEMGESVYRRAGFRSMGLTYTWDLNTNVLADNAPSDLQVKFLEAVGLGDVEALQSMSESLESGQLHDPTLNGLTPFEIAAQCQQPKSATWLLDQGVVPDIISVWDLGWKDRGSSLLAKHPEIVQREISPFAETPLHVAVERNDLDLAKLLLTVPNNMDAKDSRFRSTPVGWARHLNRPEMLSLLEKHTDTQSPASIHDALESILGKEQIREVLVNMANEA
jgi:predicted N-acetyltransferase YhbS